MNYVKNAWYVTAWAHQIEISKPFAMTILNQPIVIFRTENNSLVAFEDRCIHRLAPLSHGRCEGENLRCMYHGLLYSPEGKVIEIPGQEEIPAKAKIKTYQIIERHSWIWVWMGDPTLADEALIPPALGLESTDYLLGHGELDYDAQATLINDNLLDFTHLCYVHANSFGASETWAQQRSEVIPLDRGIRFQRWIEGEEAMAHHGGGMRDNWSSYDFIVPGILLMKNGSFPLGTAKKYQYQLPDYSEAMSGVTFTSQAVTPMTDKTSRYFFSWGPHKDFGDENVRDALIELAGKAFHEDKVIIEAQQKIINLTANPTMMPTTADKGIIMFNRIVTKLISEEKTQSSYLA